MNVRLLLDRLKDCDPEWEVVLATDAEGNDYGRCETVATANQAFTVRGSWLDVWTINPALSRLAGSAGAQPPRCVVLYPED